MGSLGKAVTLMIVLVSQTAIYMIVAKSALSSDELTENSWTLKHLAFKA